MSTVGLLLSKSWPIFVLLAVWVAFVQLFRYVVRRWKNVS